MLEITVHTRPPGGRLFVDKAHVGPDGLHMQRIAGTRLTVVCRLPGYEDGRIKVAFDGINEIYICPLLRRKKCVPGLKNPYDDCPDDE